MTARKETLKENNLGNLGVSVANSNFNQQLKIKGTLTSQIRRREEEEPYYYAFLKLKGQGTDLPVIFRTKDENNSLTGLKKGALMELTGHYSNSDRNIRKSFTTISYQILDERISMVGDQKRIKKKCSGCTDVFTCYQPKNYDYCWKCEINGSRYVKKNSSCSECDGSGIIKFPNQPVRNCKLCSLTKPKEEINSHE